MAEHTFDLVIRGGTVYDGTGAPGVPADVGVRGDRIAAIGAITERGGVELDAAGMAVTPGFIDVHAHDDWAVLLEPEIPFKVMQGVTTDIVGNCGSGVIPFEAGAARFARFHPGAAIPSFDGFGGYLSRIDEIAPSLNVAVLMGHGSMRLGAMGLEQRPPTAEELRQMLAWTTEGVANGAVGLSTGLIYEPGRYAETDELVTLARALTGGGLYASHMRNEGAALLDAVAETIHIGEAAGVGVEISHHKASGHRHWGKVRQSLALIEQARARGIDVTADQYPYPASSTSLYAVVQNGWVAGVGAGGADREIAPEDILIAAAPHHPAFEGKTLAQMADQWDLPIEQVTDRLLDQEGQALFVVLFSMSEEDVRTVLAHPTTMIGSDGVPAGSKPHPRLYGTFARVLGQYSRDEALLDLPTAIHKMTGMPAAKFRLPDRGILRPGAFADIVVFDPATINDIATYDDPCQFPTGLSAVYVNGVRVADNGRHTGARPGRGVRRG